MLVNLLDQKGFKRFLLHAIPILLYCLMSYAVNILVMTELDPFTFIAFEGFFILLCYGFARIIALLFLPRFWWVGLCAILVFSVVASVFAYYYLYRIMPVVDLHMPKQDVDFETREFVQNCLLGLFRAFIYAFLYTIIRLYKKEYKMRIHELEVRLASEMEAKRLLKENNKYLIEGLTARIFPHFLRNTFNMLAGRAANHKDEYMVNCVTGLASLMDYFNQPVEGVDQMVPVKREVKKMALLIDLIRNQLESHDAVIFEQEGILNGLFIPPLVLLTFLENALKYGEISKKYPLFVKVAYSADRFVFSCKNHKRRVSHQLSSTGLGIKNIMRRLQLLLLGRYKLKIDDQEKTYHVSLAIF